MYLEEGLINSTKRLLIHWLLVMVELIFRVEPWGAVRTGEQMSSALTVHRAHLQQETEESERKKSHLLQNKSYYYKLDFFSHAKCANYCCFFPGALEASETFIWAPWRKKKCDFTGLRPRLRGAIADVWMRWCRFKVGAWENFLSQILQL